MEKLKHLEGLRGLAAFLVFFHHIRLLFYVNSFESLDQTIGTSSLPKFIQTYFIELKNTLTDGTLFVWVFWILSAYVLCIKLFKNVSNTENSPVLFESFIKRYIRLFVPITVSVILSITLYRLGLFHNKEAAKILAEIGYNSNWLGGFGDFKYDLSDFFNLIFYGIYFDYYLYPTYNPVLWSIQSEFIGSMFIFGLFGIIKSHKNRFYIYFTLIFVLFYMKSLNYIPFVFGFLLSDLDFTKIQKKSVVKFKRIEEKIFHFKWFSLLVFFILLILTKLIVAHFQGDIAYVYIIQSLLILYFSIKNSLIKQFLSLKWIYIFGKISFSFYLIHMLVIYTFTSFLITKSISFEFKILNVILTFTLSVLVSIPYYLYIDKFAIYVSKKFANLFLTKNL